MGTLATLGKEKDDTRKGSITLPGTRQAPRRYWLAEGQQFPSFFSWTGCIILMTTVIYFHPKKKLSPMKRLSDSCVLILVSRQKGSGEENRSFYHYDLKALPGF